MSDGMPITLRAPDGSSVRIDRFPVTLGRVDANGESTVDVDLSPFDDAHTVAARHARLDWVEWRLYAVDLDSEHGSEVNGQRLTPGEPVEIGPRGTLSCGQLRIVVEVEGVEPAGTPAASAASKERPQPTVDAAVPEAAPAVVTTVPSSEAAAVKAQRRRARTPAAEPDRAAAAAEDPHTVEAAGADVASLAGAFPPADAQAPSTTDGTSGASADSVAAATTEEPAASIPPAPVPAEPPPPIPDPTAGPTPPVTAPPPRQDVVATLLRALSDPEVSDLSVEPGRPPSVRHRGVWVVVGDEAVGARTWASLWSAICARGGIDRGATGYVARLLDDAVAVEAFLPPLTAEPSLIAHRLPAPLDLGHLEDDSRIAGSDAQALREALRAHLGLLVAGRAREAVGAVLEALLTELEPGVRVAVLEPRPRLRAPGPQLIRLRGGASAPSSVSDAAAVGADWLAAVEATPELAAALVASGSEGPTPLLGARTSDAAAWRRRVGEGIGGDATASKTAVDAALGLTVEVEGDAEAGPRVTAVRRP